MSKLKTKSRAEALASLLVLILIIAFVVNISLKEKTKNLSPLIVRQEIYEEDTLYVKFNEISKVYNEQSAKNTINEILSSNEVNSAKRMFPNKNGRDNIYQVFLKQHSNLNQISSNLERSNLIEFASKQEITEPAAVIPNDHFFPWQWYHNNTGNEFWDNVSGINKSYYPGALEGADINTPEAWEITTGSENIVVAFSDTYFLFGHPDMQNKYVLNLNETPNNSIDDDGNGFVDDYYGYSTSHGSGNLEDLECNGPNYPFSSGCHGAGVTSWLANSNNSIGISSVCWNCKVMAIQGGATLGIPYSLVTKPDIYSMSWAGSYGESELTRSLFNQAHQEGIVLVSAAGNDCLDDSYGCGINKTTYPAGSNHVISVAGIGVHGGKFWTSSYNSGVDIAAPMANLHTIANLSYQNGYNAFWNKYGSGSGTSFAGPMVAAVAGLVLSVNPDLTPNEVESILQTSAGPIPSGSTVFFLGNGVVDAYQAVNLSQQSLSYGSYPVSLIDWKIKQDGSLVSVYGSAYSPDFDHYRIEIGDGNYPSNWTGYESYEQSNESLIGQFPITIPTLNATKAIRLLVYDTNGQVAKDTVAFLVSQTTPDTTPPIISSEQASLITTNKATISWLTNEESISNIKYGTTPTSLTNSLNGTFYNKTHSFEIIGLNPNTTYYVNLTSIDTQGNFASKFLSFVTLTQSDTIPPTISGVSSSPSQITILKDNVIINAFIQDNNEVASAIVEINNTLNYTLTAQQSSQPSNISELGPILAANFSVVINSLDLTPGTFNYKIHAFDPSNNHNVSEEYSFTILPTCILDQAYWEPGSTQINIKEIQPPTIYVNTTSKIVIKSMYCNPSDLVDIELREDDSILGLENFDNADLTQISFNDISLISDTTEFNTLIPWEEDYDSLNKNPEYIFRATLQNSPIPNMEVDSLNYLKLGGGDIIPPKILKIEESHIIVNTSILKLINTTFNEYSYSELHWGTSPLNLSNVAIQVPSAVSSLVYVLNFSALDPAQTYYYKIKIEDIDGNKAESQINSFTIPNTIDFDNPTIENINLSQNPILYNTTLNISANILDNFGVSNVLIEIDSTKNHTARYSNSLYFVDEIKTTALGTHTYKIIAFDTSGNKAESQVGNFQILTSLDFTPPSIINVQSQPNPVYENDTLTIFADVIDDYNVSQVLVEVDSLINFTMSNSLGDTYQTTSAPTSSLGTHNYKIIAFDSSNNKAELSGFTYNVTTTPDTTSPTISNIQSTVTENSSLISWETDEIATSEIYYNSSTPIQIGVFTPNIYNYSLISNHALYLSNLSPSTTYYYIIFSADETGNIANSSEQSFTTLSAPDTTAPIISNVASSNVNQNSAIITWNTNENSNSLVRYGTVSGVYTSSVSNLANYVTSHSLTLAGLTASTTYYYMVISNDISNNNANLSEFSFTTSETTVTPPSPTTPSGGGGSGGGGGGGSDTTGTNNQESNEQEFTSNQSENTIDLTNSVLVDKRINFATYSLTLVNGIQHTFSLSQINENSIKIILDGNEIELEKDNPAEIYLDGHRLIISYISFVENSAQITFEKETLIEAQFNFISILVVLLILVAGTLLGLSFYLKNKNKYKNL